MDAINVTIGVFILINLMIVVVSFTSSNKKTDDELVYNLYLVNILTIVWWLSSMFFYRISSQNNILLNTKILYVSATTIASSFYYFSLIFIDNSKKYTKQIVPLVLLNTGLMFFTFFGDLIIKNARISYSNENIIVFGKYYFIYVLYILYYFNSSFIRLFIHYKKESEITKKGQIFYIFIGYTASGIVAFLSNLILPWFGIFNFNWLGQISTLFMILSITYAVKKYHLFNINILTAEVFVFTLWVFTIIKLTMFEPVTSNVMGIANNINIIDSPLASIAFLIMVLVVGIMLIRSVKNETERNLENIALVAQLKKAKLKLEEVDEIKTRFVSLATHHIASPLTAIKAYTSMLKEEDSMIDTQALKSAPEDTNNIIKIEPMLDSLVAIIKDFLDISQIEAGEADYDFEEFDIHEAIDEAVEITQKEQSFLLHTNNINIKLNTIRPEMFGAGIEPATLKTLGDKTKTIKAVENILANSIKYSKDKDVAVEISLERSEAIPKTTSTKASRADEFSGSDSTDKNDKIESGSKILIKISDFGIRSLPELSPQLLQKFGPRKTKQGGENLSVDNKKTQEAKLMGRGLGVYVAKQIIEAQNGTLDIEYEEKTKMWHFYIRLNLA